MKQNLIILVSLVVVLFFGCSRAKDPASISIAQQVSKGEGTVVDIHELTSYDWDKMYFFDPYTHRDSIHSAIGQTFIPSNQIPISVAEANTLLVFTKNGNVVHYFQHRRCHGDFSGFEREDGFTPEQARFRVNHEGRSLYGKWPKIKRLD